MKRSAVGAVAAQGAQALASFVLQVVVARTLGIGGLGAFAILYGVVVLASGTVTGFVGDSLVVLDRHARPIRSALQQFAVLLAVAAGAIAGGATGLVGFTTPVESVLLALAVAAFCLEEVVRRTLMADLLFWRVAAIDTCGLVVTMGIVGGVALGGRLTLGVFLLALAVGQTVALGIGALVVGRGERYLVGVVGGGRRQVAAYGVWRSMQQFLRPALLTGVRTAVGVVAGLAATGLLEAARVYVAPALLLVSGLSSYLFASFARDRDAAVAVRLRRADRAVLVLIALTAAIGVVAVVALPVAGPLLFHASPDLRAVVGWLAYTASVAAVTPYGALAAVSGGQLAVFAVRAADTVVSLAAVLVGLALGMDPAWSAALLSIGSLAGGLVLRARSAREAGTRALPRSRTTAIAAAGTALLLACGIGAAFAVQRPTPVPTPTPTAAVARAAVIGDDLTAPAASAAVPWPDRLASSTDPRVTLLGGVGDGYTAVGGGTTYAALARRLDPGTTTVVLFGGRSDRRAPVLELVRAVSATVTAVRRAAPHARVVLVGPVWGASTPPAGIRRVRDVLRGTAEATRARFVDPIAAGWFDDGRGITPDGAGLLPLGESRIATRLRALL